MTEGADANAALKMDAKPGASARDRDASAMIRKLNVVGLAMVVVFVGCIGSWAAISELAGAVIAAGTVIVESVDKKVQHPTGGVVKRFPPAGARRRLPGGCASWRNARAQTRSPSRKALPGAWTRQTSPPR